MWKRTTAASWGNIGTATANFLFCYESGGKLVSGLNLSYFLKSEIFLGALTVLLSTTNGLSDKTDPNNWIILLRKILVNHVYS